MNNRVCFAGIFGVIIAFLLAAVIGLLISSCGSEKDASEQMAQQSSDQTAPPSIEQLFADQSQEIQKFIKAAVNQTKVSNGHKIGDTELVETGIIFQFYEQRQFRPAWIKSSQIDDLIRAIENVGADGLLPDDYHRGPIRSFSNQIESQSPPDLQLLAERDVLLTDALILLGYHLQVGKVDPVELDPNWNFSQRKWPGNPVALVQKAIESGAVDRYFDDLRPRDEYYTYLKATLAKYRSIHHDGGWQSIPKGATLKAGVKNERVDLLRKRLIATSDLVSTPDGPTDRFDKDLLEAVKHFQRRRGLKPDGIVGKNTIRALNQTDESIIDQIRVNLERIRWVMGEDLDDFLFVNIPAFKVHYVRDEKIKWSARVQVGRPYRQTPIFKAKMTRLEFNPTWTIPPTILSKDILPAVKRDPNYLKINNIQVIDKSGQVIGADKIKWTDYSGRNFPYQLRQKPGSDNALGRIKFMFPNQHAVYMHDTPGKALFRQESRAFSSGCIRVEKPFELARILLGKGWDNARMQQIINSGKTRSVNISRPIPVIMFYLTALPAKDGEFHALTDIYDRDRAVLDALNARHKPK